MTARKPTIRNFIVVNGDYGEVEEVSGTLADLAARMKADAEDHNYTVDEANRAYTVYEVSSKLNVIAEGAVTFYFPGK